MQHRGRGSVVVMGGVEISDGAGDPQVTAALEREQAPRGGGGEGGGIGVRDRVGEHGLDHPVIAVHHRPVVVGRRRGYGEYARPHTSSPHPRQIEMPIRASGGDQRVVGARDRVVVAVEHRQHGSHLSHHAAGEPTDP